MDVEVVEDEEEDVAVTSFCDRWVMVTNTSVLVTIMPKRDGSVIALPKNYACILGFFFTKDPLDAPGPAVSGN